MNPKRLKEIKILNKNSNQKSEPSRGDFKISSSVFIKEILNSNFKYNSKKIFGPLERIGAMAIFELKK